jgi:uncharacterized protein
VGEAATIAPVTGKARIEILDILRGIAILGIFFMNIPFMAAPIAKLFLNIPSLGWSPLDQASWYAVQITLEGTQRGLLELLFGAGMMVLAAKAMQPDGPVAVADLYWRRNLWLILFGLADVFVLLWPGDILHIYGLAALLLFPFRKLGPNLLLGLGMLYALFIAVTGGLQYQERAELIGRVHAVQEKQASHAALSPTDKKTLQEWRKIVARRAAGGEEMKQYTELEKKGHSGGLIAYARMNITAWIGFVSGSLLFNVAEAFCMMLIGISLWKWGVIQGQRSAGFYLGLMLLCYLPAIGLRAIAAQEMTTLVPIARTGWFSQEFARIAMSIGHVALINLVVKSGAGRALLAPFKAAGRTAFSLYFLQQIIGLWILYAPWGPNLWARQSWSDMHGTALIVIAGQLLLANLWVRAFTSGPLEWAWRSLAYVRWQPFLKSRAVRAAAPTTA